jgi:hypothetical protein
MIQTTACCLLHGQNYCHGFLEDSRHCGHQNLPEGLETEKLLNTNLQHFYLIQQNTILPGNYGVT